MVDEDEYGHLEMEICECGHLFEEHDVLDRCTLEFCDCVNFTEDEAYGDSEMTDEITEP